MFFTKFKGKKGFVYDVLMVLVVTTVLTSLAVALFIKQGKLPDPLGDVALKSMNTYMEGEKTLFMIDQAAKYSAYPTVYELAENGGFYNPSSQCGDYLGYAILYDKGKECNPNLNEEFIQTYGKNLDAMLNGVVVPDSYEYEMMQENPIKIVGVSREMLEFPISYTTEKPITKTEVCPIPELIDTNTIGIYCSATQSKCALSPGAIQALGKAMQIAENKGFELQITSGFRTYEQQQALKAEKGEQAAGSGCNAPHETGGAVDIVLRGQPYMKSTGYPMWDMSLGKRQELENIMCQAGFVRYGDAERKKGEFWHYEYNTTRWQRAKTKETETGKKVCAIV